MAHEEDTGKSTDELVERAWQIVREADSSVLITVEGDEIHARAMRPRCEQDEHVIRFLTNAGSSKVKTIASGRDDHRDHVTNGRSCQTSRPLTWDKSIALGMPCRKPKRGSCGLRFALSCSPNAPGVTGKNA